MAKFIPVEIKENREEIMKIANTARVLLDENHNVVVPVPEIIPAVAYSFLKSAIMYLNEKKEKDSTISLNIMDLIDLGISYEDGGDGEKDGNFTPSLVAGREFKLLIKDDENTEE